MRLVDRGTRVAKSRVRPGDPKWPSIEKWEELRTKVNGNLIKIKSPFDVCKASLDESVCSTLFEDLRNPYYIGENPALTQTTGWLDAWISQPSVYAVAAHTTSDVVAAVNFARTNNLRLVVKGGGHSYQGTSNAPDSLLIWTRSMNKINLQDDFVPLGCDDILRPTPAVTVESGALWFPTYDAVTTRGGRYVQGGGCATVGVAGLVQSGGFGSFSKNYGLAAAGLLEAEIVTADGSVEIVNEKRKPDLFWALKGGGGGTFGVVTGMTLRTRELPEKFGAVFGRIQAKNDTSYRILIGRIISLYRKKLFNPHWGETISFHSDNSVDFSLVFQGLHKEEAERLWLEFGSWIDERSDDYVKEMPLTFIDLPASKLWDIDFLKQNAPHLIVNDSRPGAPGHNVFWASNQGEAGQYLYGYHSLSMPKELLEEDRQNELVDAIYNASRQWTLSFHFNKGLAGAKERELIEARNTAMNPAVIDAFALLIIAGMGKPGREGIKGHEPDLKKAKNGSSRINAAIMEFTKIVKVKGSYVAESNFFDPNWKESFWGSNYPKLAVIKRKYDPEGLFFVHHGIGSEEWSEDGFERRNK